MSRIGKLPITIPAKVDIKIDGQQVIVTGPKGNLSRDLPSLITIVQEGQELLVTRENDSRKAKERHGLCRTLVANMVNGVNQGFEKKLEIQGVGYRAQAQGSKLTLNVGYSKPVEIEMPQGINVVTNTNTEVIISGIDKELVGNVAAKIRAVRPPEVYKGKGIRYAGEFVRRKVGKSGKK
ncbi:50S ribosomal protein L6 [Geminocystis sp. GBBB08]|uniref:50S ribosomal protein L6 n=1 Tax=Geminocystis sp. GBBB08 TaxID=2604140 RepID=UPI0027E24033|nr:50S ribosomal protein L6 [Geminocystis sp. GBBB08]MBL1208574.1 50S ribosomal protein L6 [Geminocystis sp. GBBB08]